MIGRRGYMMQNGMMEIKFVFALSGFGVRKVLKQIAKSSLIFIQPTHRYLDFS